jgi:hypothetical protein
MTQSHTPSFLRRALLADASISAATGLLMGAWRHFSRWSAWPSNRAVTVCGAGAAADSGVHRVHRHPQTHRAPGSVADHCLQRVVGA